MTVPWIPPVSARPAAPALRSTALFRWQAARGLTAVTGPEGVLTRAQSAVGLVDGAGQLYTAVHSMPAWEARDWRGTGTRQTVGLRLGSSSSCAWTIDAAPQTSTLLVEFSEAGTRTANGAALVYIGNDAQTGGRLILDSTGTNYRATLHNGSASESVSLATATPTTSQATRLALQLEDDGTYMRVRLWLDVLRTPGETITAWSGALLRPASWGAPARVRLNRAGASGTEGNTWVRQIAWVAGLLSPTEVAEQL